jgi:hypothetical protein
MKVEAIYTSQSQRIVLLHQSFNTHSNLQPIKVYTSNLPFLFEPIHKVSMQQTLTGFVEVVNGKYLRPSEGNNCTHQERSVVGFGVTP